MAGEANACEGAFLRGERRLTVPEYIGLVAACQAAFDAGISRLSPSSQVAMWNSFHPRTLLPSSGTRMLWVLRRGVLDDLAPRVDSLLSGDRQRVVSKDEQLAFRAALEALATGRQALSQIIGFCNQIHAWSPVGGVAEYLKGDLADAVRLASLDVASDFQSRRVRLPGWALVGTLLDAVRTVGSGSDSSAAFAAALDTLLGPASSNLGGAHGQLLAQLYRATRAGRKVSAPESALHRMRTTNRPSTGTSQEVADRLRKSLQYLEDLALIQAVEGQQIRWLMLTLVHLPPGQGARAQPP